MWFPPFSKSLWPKILLPTRGGCSQVACPYSSPSEAVLLSAREETNAQQLQLGLRGEFKVSNVLVDEPRLPLLTCAKGAARANVVDWGAEHGMRKPQNRSCGSLFNVNLAGYFKNSVKEGKGTLYWLSKFKRLSTARNKFLSKTITFAFSINSSLKK